MARGKGLVAEVQPTIRIATGAYAGASRTEGVKITNRRRHRGEAAAEESHARQPPSAIESSKETKEVGAGD